MNGITGVGERGADKRCPGFRAVAGRYATGVAVATSKVDDVPVGMTVNSFATVSLDPLLLLVCLCRGCRLMAAVERSGLFAVNVLAADQRECAQWFASKSRPSGRAGFADIAYFHDPETGCPLLSAGVAYFGCATYQRHTGGDHVVLIGEVRSWGLLRPGPPLLYLDGRYANVAAG